MANGISTDGAVSVYGAPPGAQASVVAAITTTQLLATTASFGFVTTAQANTLIAAVNSILAAIKTAGLMATA